MFAEDMSAFFNTGEMAVQAVFTPGDGGAPVSAAVIFKANTQDIFSGDVLSDEYSIVYPTGALSGIGSGDYGTVNGTRYRVRDVRKKGDGALIEAKLARVSDNGK